MTQAADPFDELASIFLTDVEDDGPDDASVAAATIELLVVGHGPVRAGIWLTPYADAIARRAGPTALVRLDGDDAIIELMRGEERDALGVSGCRSLREAILHLGDSVRAWLVRPSSRADVDDLLGSGGAGRTDRITILTSADQVAVVNTYTVVKELVEVARRTGRPLPPLGLGVLGADPERAARAAEGVDRTTRRHLDVGVPLVAGLQRIDSAIRSNALRSFPGQGRPSLSEVLGWIGEARTRRGSRTAAPRAVGGDRAASPPPLPSDPPIEPGRPVDVTIPSEPAPRLGPNVERPPRERWRSSEDALRRNAADVASRRDARGRQALAPAPLVDFVRDDPDSDLDADAAVPLPTGSPIHRSALAVKLAPKGGAELESKAPNRAREPDRHGGPIPLAHHVVDPAGEADDAGRPAHLIAVDARCPGHERIELAVDARGRLHLLALEEDLRALRVVETWAWKHRELISMACRDHEVDLGAALVRHVFTQEPVTLADLHESDLYLHVLTPVAVGDAQAWYAAPLNRPTRGV